jgi:uncharacterized protein (DUF1501 family)
LLDAAAAHGHVPVTVVEHRSPAHNRDRSHFDAQSVLESGFPRAQAGDTGWLNRALASLPAVRGAARGEQGVALGQNVPLVLRGSAPVVSWSPSRLAPIDDDTLERIAARYADDPLLSQRLTEALAANEMVADSTAARVDAAGPLMRAANVDAARQPLAQRARAQAGARLIETIDAAAGFLRRDDGPSVAVLDTNGWDTHANEGAAQGQLALRLATLDTALRALKRQLGPVWSRTVVLVATEFGRTAAANGSRGRPAVSPTPTSRPSPTLTA